MTSESVYVSAQRAVLGAFFFVGVPVGTLIPRLAEIKESIGAGDAAYGNAIALGGLGAVLGNYLGARLVHRSGSKRLALIAYVLILISNVSNALSPSVQWLAAAALLFGLSYAMVNISINSQGVLIEQEIGKSFLPKGHAFWSIGALTFGLISSLVAPYVTPLAALLTSATFGLVGFMYFERNLLPIQYDDRPHDDPTQLPKNEKIPIATFRFLIFVAFGQWLGMMADIATGDWSSVLLREDFGIAVGPNGYAYATFMFVLLGTRLSAPRLIDRFGLQQVVRTLAFIGAIGAIAFLQIANHTTQTNKDMTLIFSCVAFGFTALGVANMPAAFFSVAGSIPGLPSARALMISGLYTSIFLLVGRVVIAALSEKFNLLTGLNFALAGLLFAVLASTALNPKQLEKHAVKR